MKFTDEELSALHGLLYDKAYYGDDDIVYGDGPEAVMAHRLLDIVYAEAKKRKLW